MHRVATRMRRTRSRRVTRESGPRIAQWQVRCGSSQARSRRVNGDAATARSRSPRRPSSSPSATETSDLRGDAMADLAEPLARGRAERRGGRGAGAAPALYEAKGNRRRGAALSDALRDPLSVGLEPLVTGVSSTRGS